MKLNLLLSPNAADRALLVLNLEYYFKGNCFVKL